MIRAAYPDLDDHRLAHELVRQLIGLLIDDVVAETGRRLAALGAAFGRRGAAGAGGRRRRSRRKSARTTAPSKVSWKSACIATRGSCGSWTRPPPSSATCSPATAREPRDLPAEWQEGFSGLDEASRVRRIADFIAGMTDRYALAEHQPAF